MEAGLTLSTLARALRVSGRGSGASSGGESDSRCSVHAGPLISGSAATLQVRGRWRDGLEGRKRTGSEGENGERKLVVVNKGTGLETLDLSG